MGQSQSLAQIARNPYVLERARRWKLGRNAFKGGTVLWPVAGEFEEYVPRVSSTAQRKQHLTGRLPSSHRLPEQACVVIEPVFPRWSTAGGIHVGTRTTDESPVASPAPLRRRRDYFDVAKRRVVFEKEPEAQEHGDGVVVKRLGLVYRSNSARESEMQKRAGASR